MDLPTSAADAIEPTTAELVDDTPAYSIVISPTTTTTTTTTAATAITSTIPVSSNTETMNSSTTQDNATTEDNIEEPPSSKSPPDIHSTLSLKETTTFQNASEIDTRNSSHVLDGTQERVVMLDMPIAEINQDQEKVPEAATTSTSTSPRNTIPAVTIMEHNSGESFVSTTAPSRGSLCADPEGKMPSNGHDRKVSEISLLGSEMAWRNETTTYSSFSPSIVESPPSPPGDPPVVQEEEDEHLPSEGEEINYIQHQDTIKSDDSSGTTPQKQETTGDRAVKQKEKEAQEESSTESPNVASTPTPVPFISEAEFTSPPKNKSIPFHVARTNGDRQQSLQPMSPIMDSPSFMPPPIPRSNTSTNTSTSMPMTEQLTLSSAAVQRISTPGQHFDHQIQQMSPAAAIQPMPSNGMLHRHAIMPAPASIIPAKRRIQLRLIEDMAAPTDRRSNLFQSFRRNRPRTNSFSTTPKSLDYTIDNAAMEAPTGMDRGTMTLSWYQGTTSMELQEHVRNSVIRKLGLRGTVRLADLRILDDSVDPPEGSCLIWILRLPVSLILAVVRICCREWAFLFSSHSLQCFWFFQTLS
jgi:hypothetical protein